MKIVKKKIRRPLIIIILAAALAVLTAGAIIANTLLVKGEDGSSDSNNVTPPEIMEELGESIYLNEGIAFERVTEDHINFVVIRGDNEYSFLKYAFDSGEDAEKSFILSYVDENGDNQQYLPSISTEDPNFKYSDMYSIEQDDGYARITKLKYLCSAIGTLYFDQRMALSSDAEAANGEMAEFGLSDADEPLEIFFT